MEQQLTLFPENNHIYNNFCIVCGRVIDRGIIGDGCYRTMVNTIKKDIVCLQNEVKLLQEASNGFNN